MASNQHAMIHELNPFAFFYNHASAIEGLGGENLSPDARYCFHTPYRDVKSGAARFELKLLGVRASRGELALRVHAFRPDAGENASLVAGGRLDVAVEEQSDLAISVPFAARHGMQYAFYGYFIEDSDIHADGLTVLLHESDTEEVQIEAPRSVLALNAAEQDVRPANALIHVVTPRLHNPVSQDFTRLQISQLAASQPERVSADDWAEAICRNALDTHGVIAPALEGILVGRSSDALETHLNGKGFSIQRIEPTPIPLPTSPLFGDFMLWPEGIPNGIGPTERWEMARAWLGRIKIGGVGVMSLHYKPDAHPARSQAASDGPQITPNEIGKWALRLIADGYSVAPLALSAVEDLVLDDEGLARFAFVVQRQ